MRSLHNDELEYVNGLGISIEIPGIEDFEEEDGAFLDEVTDAAKVGFYFGLFIGTCSATVIVMTRIARMQF